MQLPLGPSLIWAYWSGGLWAAMSSAIVTDGYLERTPRKIALMAVGTCRKVRDAVELVWPPTAPVSGL
jgi:hypothetical protein